MTLLDIVVKGGVLMIPIVLCSIIAVAILIERLVALRKIRVKSSTFVLQIKYLLLRKDVEGALALCKKTPGPIAGITKAGLEKIDRPRQEIKEAIESAGRREIYFLEKYLGVLGTIAAVAPLLGFLGTVTGMIRAFMQVQVHGGNVDASVLAGGIWEALITTAAGLSVGIPALIFYNWLQGKVERFVFEMSETSTELMDLLLQPKEATDGLSHDA
ncbi:MAG: MotA/TolQ/ExbB proton channel family protein [candidate division KSB1 bacterium]|nr:MotA/TolQ/ExbB proton channel family protein [candidate division KSB1 bacterium]MDZ7294151.1 MotA/TolQ/ExbB proton channel family protein [candidate division KSB1 bacterium]MDZ7338117.1 MotA/TolQ/ExbB proton channel family protein [candidate division KSB1 bacterium]MDZ7378144.1 MotA/TolQ/ExbB proton channel family protein [candidate division KSB1 bacterium]MDZ7386129.1 MotA/TolQ/ExbB proton channel family protein [candidate division KSB1 bacterium]